MKSSAPDLPEEVRDAARVELGGEPQAEQFAWMSWAGTTWRLTRSGTAIFVKRAKHLDAERDRLAWLADRWPVPRLIGYFQAWGDDWLLTRAVDGVPMSQSPPGLPPEQLARTLGEILKQLHAVDAHDCPWGVRKRGNVLVHGDYCLPNVLVVEGRLSGLVDVGGARLSNPEDDLAAGLWSLQYNFGRGFGSVFLAAYGWPPMSDQAMERLRRRYSRR